MRHAELVLLGHLSDADSLDTLAREGFLTDEAKEVIPTDFVRRMTDWALVRFFEDGRQVAPSREAILDTWADTLELHEVELPDPEVEIDTIGFVIADLRSNYARIQAEKLGTDFASAMGQSDGPDRVEVFTEYVDRFYRVAQSLISHRHEADGYEGIRDSLLRLNDVIENGYADRGMHLGLDMIDHHMHGVHPGEICVICSESGVGKSWMAGLACVHEWRRGRKVVLVTMENDTEMTYDRLACIATGIPYESYQEGDVSDDQLKALFTLLDEMENSPNRPIITMGETGQRTVSGIVRKAQLEGADSLIIDQLSFIKPEKDSKTQGRNFQVADMMRDLKEMVSQGTLRIPVLLFVQINRNGAEAAAKAGRYEKRHLAESSETVNSADFVWAIFQSIDMAIEGTVQFQCLKARRVKIKHFEFYWQPAIGLVHGLSEVDINRQAA